MVLVSERVAKGGIVDNGGMLGWVFGQFRL